MTSNMAAMAMTVACAPDFVGVGAQRCGTTWWFQMLLEHPQIRSPWHGRKELHAFNAFGARAMTDADVAAYYEHFRRDAGQVCGEWTPRYMADPWTPRLLARAAPDARILVMLRDPIDRYRSGVAQRHGLHGQRAQQAASEAIERGRYAAHLREVLRHFEREQVLILQYERCREEPLIQYRRTLRHLGVDDFEPEDPTRLRGNSLAARKPPLWPDIVQALQASLRDDVADLAQLAGNDIDLSLWKHFRDLDGAHG
jgi:hypothetical protein